MNEIKNELKNASKLLTSIIKWFTLSVNVNDSMGVFDSGGRKLSKIKFEHLENFLRSNYKDFTVLLGSRLKKPFVRDLATLIFAEQMLEVCQITQENRVLVFKDILLLRNKIEFSVLNDHSKALLAADFWKEYRNVTTPGIHRGRTQRSVFTDAISTAVAVSAAAVAAAAMQGKPGGQVAVAAATVAIVTSTVKPIAQAVGESIESALQNAGNSSYHNSSPYPGGGHGTAQRIFTLDIPLPSEGNTPYFMPDVCPFCGKKNK